MVLHQKVELAPGEVVQVEIMRNQGNSILRNLADWAETLPADPDSPGDAAAQHDHYLYGQPKRP